MHSGVEGFLMALHTATHETGALLIFDEVMTRLAAIPRAGCRSALASHLNLQPLTNTWPVA